MLATQLENNNKAAIIYSLLGDKLPEKVFSFLDSREIEKLFTKVESLKRSSGKEENKVLNSYIQHLKSSNKNVELDDHLINEINKLFSEKEKQQKSLVDELKYIKKEDLDLITKDENAHIVALVITFANPEEVSKVIEEFPEKFRHEILIELNKIDEYSESVKNELERFLHFKYELIQSRTLIARIKNRRARKAAEILSKINPHLSIKILSKIKEKNPEYAENIGEYFYTIKDLLYIHREGFHRFLNLFHPIVIACALKGVEVSLKDEILNRCDLWLSKAINVEIDSMGPVSIAEIEEAQKGMIHRLNECIDMGEIKMWKVNS